MHKARQGDVARNKLSRNSIVTLLYGAKDQEMNQAVVLLKILKRMK
jgi:uncharacterized protein YeaO (DUF488 family)